ncbi:BgTH12-04884 [Blumeria graminis f. sp. triticale]|uniref:Bgt-20239 n=2 Tax=Blumeria graminis TaxID=34373 RepID=A0A9X9L7T8_BLUGR|nr:BgTH12-04883 [Blumeria graminis f. sp. triticale]CAD6499233.1 BgTH12-04884 [Blumeria graminis f. sp. triticale]VCU39345.1 Bgt-20239 [Blumeria graminis f. sp. tritici]VCU39346.1 Bgt-50003 [Blumeria graminis f. sp. tritici]
MIYLSLKVMENLASNFNFFRDIPYFGQTFEVNLFRAPLDNLSLR